MSDQHGAQRFTLQSLYDGVAIPALRAPANGNRLGGVVVIQEIFGLTTHIEDMCAQFANAGYESIAPALFARIDPEFHAEINPDGFTKGRTAVAATPWDQAMGDVAAAIATLPKPCFIVGFCYGGAVAWRAASMLDDLAGASCFYGRQIVDLLDKIPRVPTMLHYGANDPAIPMSDVDKVREAAPSAECFIYEAGHGFCRKGSKDYSALARKTALTRTLDLFSRLAAS